MFWNWLFVLRRNSKHKEKFCWHGQCMKRDVFFKNFFSKCEQICRYLYFKMLLQGSWNCIHLWSIFFAFVFYILQTIKLWNGSIFPRNDYEGWILKPVKYKYLSNSYHDEMENRRAYVAIFDICLYFSFEIRSSVEPLCHTKHHDKYFLPTQIPKTSDWRFVWQNGYGRCPLSMTWILHQALKNDWT